MMLLGTIFVLLLYVYILIFPQNALKVLLIQFFIKVLEKIQHN
jgi:hypothetical protein